MGPIKISGANESRISEVNKSEASKAIIEADKKASRRTISSIDNSVDSCSKLINQYIGLASLVFTTIATINCARNFNLAIPKEILSNAAIFTLDKFLLLLLLLSI